MKEVTAGLVGPDAGKEMGVYFDYICPAWATKAHAVVQSHRLHPQS